MRYCADTWFLLELFERDPRALLLFEEVKSGKDWLYISTIAYAETFKKLFHRGIPEDTIDAFFDRLAATSKSSLVTPDARIAKEAAKVSLTFRVPLIDAFIAATAKVLDCNVLLSKDADFAILARKKYLKVRSW